MPDPLSWLVICICIFLSFFFSASETAIACCNIFKMKVKAEEGSKPAKLVLKILDDHRGALTTALIGNNVSAIAISAFSTILFSKYFQNVGLEQYASILTTAIMTIVVYVLGDTLPKTIAKAIPDTISLIFVYPIYFLMLILYPINKIFSLMVSAIEKIFKVKEKPILTEEEFTDAVDDAIEDDSLTDEQNEIIHNSLDFSDTHVKEVFTPISKMFMIDFSSLTHDLLNEILSKTNYSRIPVYSHDFNNIIGVLHVKSYLESYFKNNNKPIKSCLNKPYFISPNVLIKDLFNGFKKHHTHIAIVKNKEGKVIGMVTMEDVLEEIVSNISEPNKGGK